MDTIDTLSKLVASYGAAISSLPSQLILKTGVPLVSSELSHLASDLDSALSTITSAQQGALITNATWLAGQRMQLSSVVPRLPAAGGNTELLDIIQMAATRHNILSVWSPDIWSLPFLFSSAILLKVGLASLLSPSAIARARGVLRGKYNVDLERDIARSALQKPARSVLGHLANLVVSVVAVIFQLLAWRLFVSGSQPMRFADCEYFLIAFKLVLLGYAVDLVFGDLRPDVFLHHLGTFALMCLGMIQAHETKSPKFFRFAQSMLLQATLEQSTYLAMAAYHFSTYLPIQDHRPDLQIVCLKIAHKSLVFTTWTTWAQKIVPVVSALYWIGSMWRDIDGMGWGKAWLAWSTFILVLLLLLQIKFCDDVKPLADHIGYKLHGGPRPPRTGLLTRLLLSSFNGRPKAKRSNVEKRTPRGDGESYKDETACSSPALDESEKGFPDGRELESLPQLSRKPALP